MKSLAIFDMDGTIADTSSGIFGSIRYTQKKMGLQEITEDQMYSFVGPPMEESYAKYFGLSGEPLKAAVNYHKEYAMACGYRELEIYKGIPELLNDLKRMRIHTAVATLKAQTTAEKILREFKLDALFDVVIGTDAEKPMAKSEMIRLCMNRLRHKQSETVLIGDSVYDAKAAKETGVGFIAVTYGFGFKPAEKIHDVMCICNDVRGIMIFFDRD